MKWIIRILAVIVIMAGAGYIFREQIILELAGIAAKRQYDIGRHREVSWSRADSAADRDADRRPNIILIMADDLGWNDITLDAHNAEQKQPAWPMLIESMIRIDKTFNAPGEPDDEYVFCSN